MWEIMKLLLEVECGERKAGTVVNKNERRKAEE
jgi:hypothetical protein